MSLVLRSLKKIDILPYANYQAEKLSGRKAVQERDRAYKSEIDPSLWHPKGKNGYVRDLVENVLSDFYGETPGETPEWSKAIHNLLQDYMKPVTRDSDSDSYFNPISEISSKLFDSNFYLKNNHLLRNYLTQCRRNGEISLADLIGAIRHDYNKTYLSN